jgi:hypothetical protein
MPDLQAMIARAKEELESQAKSLAEWETFASVTITDEKGKSFDARAEMITRCKVNMQKYRQIIAGLEKRAEKPN